MKLGPNERLLLTTDVEADDTGRHARLYLTAQRLVIEYDTPTEAQKAIGEAVSMGHAPLPFPAELHWYQVDQIQSIHRLSGPAALKIIYANGQASLWKTRDADLVVRTAKRARLAREGLPGSAPPARLDAPG